jgi:hypothetical protein
MKPRFRRHRRRRHKPSPDHFFQKEGSDTSSNDTPKPFFEVPHVQAKMEIGKANDPMEQQADSIADQVVNDKTNVMRMEEEEESIQAKGSGELSQTSNAFSSTLKSKKGKGSGLPKSTLQEMNRSFGSDFSSVSVHTDDEAQRMNQQIQAQAFTYGNDIFFNKQKFNPKSKEGKHLLAHELTHVLQQSKRIQKEDDQEASEGSASETPKTWSEKVTDLDDLEGAAQNIAYKNLISEAIGTGYTMHESTNEVATFEDAATGGNYKEWGTNKDVNYDANLNTKTGDPDQYGQAQYVNVDGAVKIYVVLGPNSINSVGPTFTQMANDHEQAHAKDFKAQMKKGDPHAATEGEELAIYTNGFITYFLDLFVLDKTNCDYDITEGFTMMFNTYENATKAEQKAAFKSIKSYYKISIKGKGDDEIKFKVWFQAIINSLGIENALVKKINALDGLGFKKDTSEYDHINCESE